MDYICSAVKKWRSYWWPKPKPELEPLNPRVNIMDPPPTLKELNTQLDSLSGVVYFKIPNKKKFI